MTWTCSSDYAKHVFQQHHQCKQQLERRERRPRNPGEWLLCPTRGALL